MNKFNPQSGGVHTLGTLWSWSLFPGRCPSNYNILLNYIGRLHDFTIGSMSDSEIIHRLCRTSCCLCYCSLHICFYLRRLCSSSRRLYRRLCRTSCCLCYRSLHICFYLRRLCSSSRRLYRRLCHTSCCLCYCYSSQ